MLDCHDATRSGGTVKSWQEEQRGNCVSSQRLGYNCRGAHEKVSAMLVACVGSTSRTLLPVMVQLRSRIEVSSEQHRVCLPLIL